MTIDEAIEAQEIALNHSYIQALPEVREAMKLGIEALKEIMELRNMSCSIENFVSWPLRDETIMKGGDAHGQRPSGESPQKG